MNATVATIRRLFRNAPAMDSWEEGKHPRGEGGRFGKGTGGGAAAKIKRIQKAERGVAGKVGEKAAAVHEKETAKAEKSAAKPVAKPKAEKKPKAESKPKIEKKPKAEAKPKKTKETSKTKQTNYFVNPEEGSYGATKTPEAFHSEMKRLNAYASLTTGIFNEKLGEKLGIKVPKGASLAKAIERFKKSHSDADILKAAGVVANENTRIH